MGQRIEAQYDVLVAGGGAAGVGAAIGAAQAGAKVCLVEKYGFLGGAATNAQVLSYCGFFQRGPEPRQAVGGVGEIVLQNLRHLGLDANAYRSETTGNWIILLDPERLKLALDRTCAAHGVDVLLHTRVAAATRTGAAIEAVTLAGMGGRTHAVAESYVDASGDANLAMVSGLDCRTGDEEGRLQAATLPIRIGGLSPDLKIDRAAIQNAIRRYNAQGRFPIAQADGGIYTRLPGSRDFWWLTVDLPMEDLSSDTFTKAEQRGREMAYDYVEMLRAHVPGFENCWLAQTGPQIGVRETRHPLARTEMTGQDIVQGRQRDDGVARAAWSIELHGEAGKPVYRPVGGDGYADVPYDALRAAGVDNLWYAGRVIGADPEAYGSIRVMGTAFATGEAAGVSAADYVDGKRQVNVTRVRKRLLAQGAIL